MLAFVDELIPLYPVYALLFADAGLTSGQISLLFGIWSLAGFVLEVPTGALADRVSRRNLLAFAQVVRAAGFACWVVWPSFTGFAVGFVLWGASGAASSGTWEALLYDEFAALGVTDRYVKVVGRVEAVAAAGTLAGTALAGPIIALGGYSAAGWASVAVCLLAAAIAFSIYASPRATAGQSQSGYLQTLKAGVQETFRNRSVARMVLVVALLSGVTAIEEYFALLAREYDLPLGLLPLLLLLPPLGYVVGAEIGGRLGSISPRRAAWLVAVFAALMFFGALWRHPLGFLGVVAGYGGIECVLVVAGARLQDVLTGPRATVTSVSAFGEEVVALAVYGVFGALSGTLSLPWLMALSVAPLFALAALVPRWLPPGD